VHLTLTGVDMVQTSNSTPYVV